MMKQILFVALILTGAFANNSLRKLQEETLDQQIELAVAEKNNLTSQFEIAKTEVVAKYA